MDGGKFIEHGYGTGGNSRDGWRGYKQNPPPHDEEQPAMRTAISGWNILNGKRERFNHIVPLCSEIFSLL